VRDWTDVRDVTRLLAAIAKLPQRQRFEAINGGSGIGTTVAEVADVVVKKWDGDVSVRFSGVVRAGDPFSLVAEGANLRALEFDWQIPVSQGLADYVTWFKDQVR
jgi:UDP-glucose 4-epimerase